MKSLSTPDKIREAGEKIYADQFKVSYEREHPGDFVAIDVLTGAAYLAKFPENALKEARAAAPNGIFHLIRVGSAGAIKVSYVLRDTDDLWFARQTR